MVYVRLEQAWVDGAGASHGAGDMVDVDAGTLAELEASGVVAAPGEPEITVDPVTKAWAGPGSADR